MKLHELSAAITEVSAQVAKVKDEALARIAALETALQDLDLPNDAVVALTTLIVALSALREFVQALDDVTDDITDDITDDVTPDLEPIPDPV